MTTSIDYGIFTGWWVPVAGQDEPVQVRDSAHYEELSFGRRDTRPAQPTRDEALAVRWRDDLEGYWSHGLTVYADHCVRCGWYAKVLAFNNAGVGWSWRVTECKRCGVVDSRDPERKI